MIVIFISQKRKRGRPKGSLNKKKSVPEDGPRRGRPKGSKNKKQQKLNSESSRMVNGNTKGNRPEAAPLSLCNKCGTPTLEGVHIDSNQKCGKDGKKYTNGYADKDDIGKEINHNVNHVGFEGDHANYDIINANNGTEVSENVEGVNVRENHAGYDAINGSSESSSDCDDLEEDIEIPSWRQHHLEQAEVAANTNDERHENAEDSESDISELTEESDGSDIEEPDSEESNGQSPRKKTLLAMSPSLKSSSEYGYKCKHCDQIWTSHKFLRQHEQTHEQKTYTCEFCNKDISVEERRHHHLEHAEFNPKQDLINCQYCGYKASSMLDLLAHERDHRKQNSNYDEAASLSSERSPSACSKKAPTARKSTAKQHHANRNDERSWMDVYENGKDKVNGELVVQSGAETKEKDQLDIADGSGDNAPTEGWNTDIDTGWIKVENPESVSNVENRITQLSGDIDNKMDTLVSETSTGDDDTFTQHKRTKTITVGFVRSKSILESPAEPNSGETTKVPEKDCHLCKVCNKFYATSDSLGKHNCIPVCETPSNQCKVCLALFTSQDLV